MLNPKFLKEFLDQTGLKYHQNAKSFIFSCPRCRKDKKLFIRKSDGQFICWYCKDINGFAGRAEFALAELLEQPVKGVQEALYGDQIPQASLTLDYEGFFDGEAPDEYEVPNTITWDLDYYPIDHHFSQKGVIYLKSRGISLEVAKFYGIRYCPATRSIYFPIEQDGRLIGWQSRLTIPNEWYDSEGNKKSISKAITLPGLKKDRVLMFGDRLKGLDHAIVTEGPISAIKAHLCGGNTATLGKIVSQHQYELYRAAGIKRLYIGLDPDAAPELMKMLRDFGDLECYLMRPKKGDLGDCTFEEVLDLFVNAPRASASQVYYYLKW